ncbi:MAG TPA: hypothetical protein VKX46_14620 [Ktedonobacteraceae bacterium]|nr:hypothetical protein [Ktedonobacteraceae bacterium]
MPVLESTEKAMPRSALRYRPLDDSSKRSIITTAAHPIAQRASRVRPQPADDLVTEWQRGDAEEPARATSARRKTNPPVKRVSGNLKKLPGTTSHTTTRNGLHPLLFLGLGMLAMLVLWVLLSAGLNWWNGTMDYLHYGYPRTFQTDAIVGHNDSAATPSHFLAINLHGRIEIIEFPGGDGSHARIYLGPQLFGSDADKTPVTLRFADVNGDHKADMLVFFQSSWIVFINDQGSFRSPTAQERQDAVQYLATHGQS